MAQEKIETPILPLQENPQRPLRPLLLLCCAGIIELCCLLIVLLSPLPELHLYPTPLLTAWTWLQASIHPGRSLARVMLSFTLLVLVGVYVFAISRVRPGRKHVPLTKQWLLLILACTLLFGVTLLVQPALFSDDVFTYILSGRMLTLYHADPLNTAPIQFPGDPYLQWTTSGSTPSIYGPLWLCVASLLAGINAPPIMTLFLFKGLALVAHLFNCLLVWAILTTIAPQRRLYGTLLYAWNPLALIELAGSGHSEGLLLTLLLLAVLCYVRGTKRWHEIEVLCLFGLAVSMNLIVALLVPLFVWFLMRGERNLSRAIGGFCWRLCVAFGVALLICLPFWRGPATFFAITSAADMSHFVHSPIGLLTRPTEWFFGLVAIWSRFPPVMQPTTAADVTLRASTIFLFVLVYVNLFSQVRGASTTLAGMRYSLDANQQTSVPGFDVLLMTWGSAVFWYLMLVQGLFWPWYVLWGFWIIVLRRLDGQSIAMLLLSVTALMSYPLLNSVGTTVTLYQPVLIFGLPLVYILIYRIRARERTAVSYDR